MLRPTTREGGGAEQRCSTNKGGIMLRIEFSGEASETFERLVHSIVGYTVRLTLQSGSEFDATLLGPARSTGWYDSVRYKRNDENDEPTGPVCIARVEAIHVY